MSATLNRCPSTAFLGLNAAVWKILRDHQRAEVAARIVSCALWDLDMYSVTCKLFSVRFEIWFEIVVINTGIPVYICLIYWHSSMLGTFLALSSSHIPEAWSNFHSLILSPTSGSHDKPNLTGWKLLQQSWWIPSHRDAIRNPRELAANRLQN